MGIGTELSRKLIIQSNHLNQPFEYCKSYFFLNKMLCIISLQKQKIPPVQMPLLISWTLSFKSLKESTVNVLLGPEAIWLSSARSTLFPMPKTNTADPFVCRHAEAWSRGVKAPTSVVCFPAVMTKTGYPTVNTYCQFTELIHSASLFLFFLSWN